MRRLAVLAIVLGASIGAAQAADVSTLQSSLRFAREDMTRAKDKHDADAAEVAQWQKRLDEATARLNEAKLREARSQQEYQAARTHFDEIGAQLDEAWKSQESGAAKK